MQVQAVHVFFFLRQQLNRIIHIDTLFVGRPIHTGETTRLAPLVGVHFATEALPENTCRNTGLGMLPSHSVYELPNFFLVGAAQNQRAPFHCSLKQIRGHHIHSVRIRFRARVSIQNPLPLNLHF